VHDQAEMGGKVNARLLRDGVRLGVTELIARCAGKMSQQKKEAENQSADETAKAAVTEMKEGAAIASALSTALCVMNRFMVSAHGGVSALRPSDALPNNDDNGGSSTSSSSVIAALSSNSKHKKARRAAEERDALRRARGMLSPRCLIIQATDDRTSDYNAFMNCVFCSKRFDIVIDGCFIPSGWKGIGHATTSTFLEQAVDRTGGVFSCPRGAAQANGCLTEVMITAFLPPPSARPYMNLPALQKVDFRARCFDTGESVDIASVCNQCLSIFKVEPKEFCPTCGQVVTKKKKKGKENGEGGGENQVAKRARIS